MEKPRKCSTAYLEPVRGKVDQGDLFGRQGPLFEILDWNPRKRIARLPCHSPLWRKRVRLPPYLEVAVYSRLLSVLVTYHTPELRSVQLVWISPGWLASRQKKS